MLDELLKETGAKSQDATLKVGDKEMKVRHLTGTMKQARTKKSSSSSGFRKKCPVRSSSGFGSRRMKGVAVAETTIELVKFEKK